MSHISFYAYYIAVAITSVIAGFFALSHGALATPILKFLLGCLSVVVLIVSSICVYLYISAFHIIGLLVFFISFCRMGGRIFYLLDSK